MGAQTEAHGLQAEAMLVGRPDLDRLARMLARFFGGDFRELLWNGPPLLPAS